MKRLGKAFVSALMLSVMLGSTVLATPTRTDLNNAKNDLRKLENKMTSLISQLNETEKQLVSTGQAIIKAEDDLAEAEEKEKVQYEAMKKRIVTMYENGSGSTLTMVLESGSFVEFLQQIENVQAIYNYDRRQLNEYVKNKEKIVSLKASLEADMASLEAKQKEFEKDKESLNTLIANAENKVNDISRRIQNAGTQASGSSGSTYVPPVGTGGGAAIVAEAYKYLGIPYVWGGESMRGVDCSGLVMLAHRAIGVRLYHYTGNICYGGAKVASQAAALPGDVVCYPTHCGIYLGGGLMIHAPHSGEVVKVVKVYGSPWYRRYW